LKCKPSLTREEFKWAFRECCGELSIPEIINNAELIEFIRHFEKRIFPNPKISIFYHGVARRFRALLSRDERRNNTALLTMLDELEERIAGGFTPHPPAPLKIQAA
jgi:hypothetical protein